ncbi:MAG: hypothetical protein RL398_1120 [Planctomycetota bacterium]
MIYRFEIRLAHVDKGVYEDLDLRVAQHPSEDVPYLLTRVLARTLEHEEDLEFGRGVSDAEEPAVWRRSPDGRVLLWLDVGSPAPERLHRANKLAERVVVYGHRRPDLLAQRCAKEGVHRAETIELVAVPTAALDALAAKLDRNNRWDVSVTEGLVTIVVDGEVVEATFARGPLVAKE